MRFDNRKDTQIRKLKIEKDYIKYPEGSVLISMGDTKVICNASVQEGVPSFLEGTGKGWVTAEYSMLPRATQTRNKRDISRLKISPRSSEISRLIGRALRCALDTELLGERTITFDCDVISADGGTRCASITGAYVALALAINRMLKNGLLEKNPIICQVAAISVGIVDDTIVTDLCYKEDSSAMVDMNVIMTSAGKFVEIQGTGEGRDFDQSELIKMLSYAKKANLKLFKEQQKVIESDK